MGTVGRLNAEEEKEDFYLVARQNVDGIDVLRASAMKVSDENVLTSEERVLKR